MKSNIILFGEIGAGKDTVAGILQKHGYVIGKLGAPIRANVTEYAQRMQIPPEEFRGLLVKYGQGMRQIFGEDLWCETLVKEHISDIHRRNLCIADARQVNEYFFFRIRYDFTPVAIRASELVRRTRVVERDGVDQFKNFDDETEQQARKVFEMIEKDPKGITIYNDGAIEDLEYKVKKEILGHRLTKI